MISNSKDTIAAISTKPGEAAIGIVRLSGERATKIAGNIFKSGNNKKINGMDTYTMAHGYIFDENKNTVDQVIVSVMLKPKSYTREDVVEINCHGGIVATEKVLDMCLKNGARLAEPGEFTRRAFLNGRIDLSQAEAVIDLIRAKTEKSITISANNLRGVIGKKINSLKERILGVLVELEANIDFVEEDLELTPYKKLEETIRRILEEIEILIEDEKRGESIKNGVKVTIVGKPNVGKSSLLNAIARKEKAIVTHIPGTTRDAIEEILNIDGIPLILVDTAGIRKTKNIIEKIGVEKSYSHIEESELIIMVIDSSIPIDDLDENIIGRLKNKKTLVCINKVDLPEKINKKEVAKKFNFKNIVEISVKEKKGLDVLENKIREIIFGSQDFDIDTKIIVNKRHSIILSEVKKLLQNAVRAMEEKMSEEFPSSDLKIAYELLGDIIGKTDNEDVINGVFSKFCIGK